MGRSMSTKNLPPSGHRLGLGFGDVVDGKQVGTVSGGKYSLVSGDDLFVIKVTSPYV